MPFLRAKVPRTTKYLKASAIMAKDPIMLPSIANMEQCKRALQSHHNAYPVVNTAGRLVGLMPKNIVVTILEKKSFYDKDSIDRSQLLDDVSKPFENKPSPNHGSLNFDENEREAFSSQDQQQ